MSDLLWEGLNLALFGMGFVFIFLIVLVFLTGAMSSLVCHFTPITVGANGKNHPPSRQSELAASNKKRQGLTSQVDTNENNAVVAAVTAAVRLHHSKRS